MGQAKHYSVGRRDLSCANHWEEIDVHDFIICKPTVLCFGGNHTTTPQDANSTCKLAQSLVGIKEPITPNEIATTKDVDFIGIAYGSNYDDDFNFAHELAYDNDSTGSLTKSERQDLTNIFKPLYQNAQGILSREQILKNFNLITFFAHCHGASEVSVLVYKVYHNMIDAGVDKQTAIDAIMQTFAVSYAPMRSIPCPGLQVISEKDRTLIGGPFAADISSEFLARRFENEYHFQHNEGTVAFKENDDIISLIVSNMTTTDRRDDHPIGIVARDENWRIKAPDIAYGDEVSIAMGVALATSIANGLHNQSSTNFIPKPKADEILSKVKSVLGKTQNQEFANAIKQIENELNPNHSQKLQEITHEYEL